MPSSSDYQCRTGLQAVCQGCIPTQSMQQASLNLSSSFLVYDVRLHAVEATLWNCKVVFLYYAVSV